MAVYESQVKPFKELQCSGRTFKLIQFNFIHNNANTFKAIINSVVYKGFYILFIYWQYQQMFIYKSLMAYPLYGQISSSLDFCLMNTNMVWQSEEKFAIYGSMEMAQIVRSWVRLLDLKKPYREQCGIEWCSRISIYIRFELGSHINTVLQFLDR